MRGEVEGYMKLAEDVGKEASRQGSGERVGVCVVERVSGDGDDGALKSVKAKGRVVAVAGDARWLGWEGREGGGNVMAHAVLRAVGMVAEGLRRRGEEAGGEIDVDDRPPSELTPPPPATGKHFHSSTENDTTTPVLHLSAQSSLPFKPLGATSTLFRDTPLSLLEAQHYDTTGNENGYLCHNLELYLTHEPCVMCSMAIVHSRFGRVVFRRRMKETGGLCADGGLGHGLAWRRELNWGVLGWEWSPGLEEEEDGESGGGDAESKEWLCA